MSEEVNPLDEITQAGAALLRQLAEEAKMAARNAQYTGAALVAQADGRGSCQAARDYGCGDALHTMSIIFGEQADILEQS